MRLKIVAAGRSPFWPLARKIRGKRGVKFGVFLPNGSSEGVKIFLDKPLEEGNSAFTAIPVIYVSPATVAMKLDEMAEITGPDLRLNRHDGRATRSFPTPSSIQINRDSV